MKKIFFTTLGCRVNQYESRGIYERLQKIGYEETNSIENADAIVVNTCSVTGDAARKSRQMIRRALRQKEKDPNVIICASGCFIEGELDSPKKDDLFDMIDIICSNGEKEKIPEMISEFESKREKYKSQIRVKEVKKYQEFEVTGSKNARAFIKIEDGCNSFCSYCFVPYVRGRVRSRSKDEIYDEVKRVSENGFSEIVLTGIETGAYGEDLPDGCDLISLVEKVSEIETVKRIRFGSLKPTVLTDEFLSRLSKINKATPFFHLSLQSGSTRILFEMNRHYDRNDEIRAINDIYRYYPDAGLSADIICGFPSETDEDYLDTESIISENNFLHTHIFPFSPRKGTIAAKRNDFVDENAKKDRCTKLLEAAKKSSSDFAQKRVGKEYTVLCEKIVNGKMFGYTENFIYTSTPCPEDTTVGLLYKIELTGKMSFSVETMTVEGKYISIA